MKKITQEEFVRRASKMNGNKYDYSKSVYIRAKEKIIITCKIHGDFLQDAWSHLQGFGCSACSNNLKLDTKQFIKKAIKKHGNEYDYSKSIYKSRYEKVIIKCHRHGEFLQSPSNHLHGQGCPICYGTPRKSSEEFIKNANQQHGKLYDYSKINYSTAHVPINIVCKIHGDFFQTPHNHLKGHGCPVCNSSRGELQIETWLKNNNIYFERQKTFDNLRNPKTNKKLHFDFYIPSKNILIEYDGEQHFNCISHKKYKMTMTDLKNNRYRDKLKTIWARNNKRRLLRIPYTEFSNIDMILKEKL